MSGLEWRVKPIDRWLGERSEKRKSHPFRTEGRYGHRHGVDWSSTTTLLERELRMLKAVPGTVILQMEVTDRDIRKDGWIRANASPRGPGVILTFESRLHGHLSYPCDSFTDWQANVRAIALALEALRKVSRYGVGRHGESYRGWKALPAEISGGPHAVIARFAVCTEEDVRRNPEKRIREARLATHPDRGGARADWDQVADAASALGVK